MSLPKKTSIDYLSCLNWADCTFLRHCGVWTVEELICFDKSRLSKFGPAKRARLEKILAKVPELELNDNEPYEDDNDWDYGVIVRF